MVKSEAIDRLAVRVAELLEPRLVEALEGKSAQLDAGQLVDAAEAARTLGVSRAWVYEHAAELGVIRLGDGDKPRLRFAGAVHGRARDASGARPSAPAAADPRRAGPTMTPRTVPALRCRICGSIRIVASSHERATRMLEALGPRAYRLVELPAAEARIAACAHRTSINQTQGGSHE